MKNHVSSSPSSRAIPVNDLVLPDDERKPQANKTANNDPSESIFATFTDVLCNSGRISIDSAVAIGQA